MSNRSPFPSPPQELVQRWIKECDNPEEPRWQEYEQDIATQAAQWGADQELEACCADVQWVWGKGKAEWLRSMRRPEPPSLKERLSKAIIDGDERKALKLLEELDDSL